MGVISFSVKAESARFYAYLAFWGMCAFAIVMAKTLVAPLLAAGPAVAGDTCGPFNRDWEEGGVVKGEGFDFATQSHLQQLFGFKNICANWDYSPSRELTAMVYPTFEYLLLIYLVLDFWTTKIHYNNGMGVLPEWFWKASCVIFSINIFLCAQFRMIFVCIAYENVKQHTAGFLGLQVALFLIAIQNSAFLYYTESGFLADSAAATRTANIVYLCGLIPISITKIIATIYVVQNGHGAPWTLKLIAPNFAVGQLVDLIWMIFNAICPLIISFIRSKNEEPLVISISQAPEGGAAASETDPLKNGEDATYA